MEDSKMVANPDEIEINGEKYVKASLAKTGLDTDHVIVIAQRGLIFEGYRDNTASDAIRLLNANVVRSWTNGRGIGGLTKAKYKDEYTLDPVGVVDFAPEGVIATIQVEW